MKYFEDFVSEGIIKKTSINKSKAKFLIEETERTSRSLFKRIETLGIDDDNANSITKDCYDIIMELIRAALQLSGYSSSGAYAHEAEISFLRKLKFSELEIVFINDLRINRNGITYYGKILNKDDAERIVSFTKKTYPKLKKLVIEKI